MIGSNKHSIKVLYFALFLVTFSEGCKPKQEKERAGTNVQTVSTGNGYLESSSFKSYFEKIPEKKETLYSTKRLFSLIGEESFLYESDYDFYAVYMFASESDTLNIYSLKSKNGLVTASYRRYDNAGYIYYIDKDTKGNDTKRYINSGAAEVVDSTHFIAAVDKMKSFIPKIKNSRSDRYGEPLRILYCFDGKEFYTLSKFTLDPNVLDSLHSYIVNLDLFRK